MKIFNIVGVIIFTLITTASINSQDRNILWSHGLGETGTITLADGTQDGTWLEMQEIFDAERRIDGRSPGYGSFVGVGLATDETIADLETEFGINGSREPQNIGIGHSMGGIVHRNIDVTETGVDQRFGGIITVGTPNDGIILSNNLENGRVDQVLTHACGAVLAGPTSEIPGVSIIINAVLPEGICTALSEFAIEPLLGEQVGNQSAQDLQVNSGVINDINNGGSGIPQISIWGNERSPVHWRLLSSFDTNAANDTKWVENAEDFRSVYNGFYIGHLSASISCAIAGFFAPPCWAISATNGFQAYQWKRGVNWFDNSEGIWNQLINCGGDITQTASTVTITFVDFEEECACEEIEFEYLECIEEWLEKCANNPEECWITKTTYRTVIVNKRSDGFICRDAQIIDGIPQNNIYRADDANHIEEVEPFSEVQTQLRKILNDRGENDFFTTEEN